VALATLAGIPFASDKRPFPWTRETVALLALWIWFTFTTITALYPDTAWPLWVRTSKILLMTFVALPFFQDRTRLRLLLFVVALSLGFYGLKGGIFAILTGGEYLVWGAPGDTFVSSNNALGLALNMSLPLFLLLSQEEPRAWLRLMLRALFGLSILAVLFTYSRGAVIGLMAVLTLLVLTSRRRLLLIPPAIAAGAVVTAYAPERWIARIQTIQTFSDDASALGRLLAWGLGITLANERPLVGGGFSVFAQPEIWLRYVPELPSPRFLGVDAHSIYFNLLGEHGYVGLTLFLALVTSALLTLTRLGRLVRGFPELAWIASYARMLRLSIVAYLVTGAFLSVAYSDLFYTILAATILLKVLADQHSHACQPNHRLSKPISPPTLATVAIVSRPSLRLGPVARPEKP
jgi:probable O-glycosylation ligase (exosortase A-associated)